MAILNLCPACGKAYQKEHCEVCPKCGSKHCDVSGEGKGCNYCDDSGD